MANVRNQEFARSLNLKEIGALLIEHDENSVDRAITINQLAQRYPDCNVTNLGGDNNFNILMQKKDGSAEVVIQSVDMRKSAQFAQQEFPASDRPPQLANVYAQTTVKEQPGNYQAFNSFPTSTIKRVSIVEKCPNTLDRQIARIHAAPNSGENALNFAVNIGNQVSDMLSKFKEKDVLWFDMKPGNILLRADNQIVIADPKGLHPASMMIMRKTKDGRDFVGVANMEITEAMCSKEFIVNKLDNLTNREEAKQAWEKENSYQMGCILYKIATNQTKLSLAQREYVGGVPEGPNNRFDFSHPTFVGTDERSRVIGARLQSIIERLAHDNPDKRMNHKDAAILLRVIQNDELYNKFNAKLTKTEGTTLSTFKKLLGGTEATQSHLEQVVAKKEISLPPIPENFAKPPDRTVKFAESDAKRAEEGPAREPEFRPRHP